MNSNPAHCAIAVEDIGESVKFFQDNFGLMFGDVEENEDQKVKTVFSLENGFIELIQASSELSPDFPFLEHPVKSFLSKRGQGIHHLCLKVANIDDSLESLSNKGIRAITPIFEGHNGGRAVFLRPSDTLGILIELVEGE